MNNKQEGPIRFSFVKTNYITRWHCDVCGGTTEKESVLCEVTEGPEKGLRVCEQCLKAGQKKVNDTLRGHAESLEEEARYIRSLIGRLKLPSYESRQEALKADEEEFGRALEGG